MKIHADPFEQFDQRLRAFAGTGFGGARRGPAG